MYHLIEEGKTDSDIHLIPDADVRKIKALLAQPHRSVAEWNTINDILWNHDLLVIAPEKESRKYRTYGNMMSEANQSDALMSFTNMRDCMRHIAGLNRADNTPDRHFRIGAMPGTEVFDVADDTGRMLFVDFISSSVNCRTMFIAYQPDTGRIGATFQLRF